MREFSRNEYLSAKVGLEVAKTERLRGEHPNLPNAHEFPRMRSQLSQLHLPQILSPRNPVCSISWSKLSSTSSISSTFACENTTRPTHRIPEAESHARDNMVDDSSFEFLSKPSMRSDFYTILDKVELLPLPLLFSSTGPLQFPSTGCASTCPSRARPTLCPRCRQRAE